MEQQIHVGELSWMRWSSVVIHTLLYWLASSALLPCITMPAMTLAAYGTRLPVYRLKLFLGPSLFRIRLSQHRLDIGCIPYGGWIEFWPPDHADEQTRHLRFMSLPIHGLLAVGVACVVPQVSIGIVVLGWREALESGMAGWWQFWAGGFHFWGTGQTLLNDAREVADGQGFVGVLGHTAAKFGLFMALPLPVLNFGMLLQRLAFGNRPRAWQWAAAICFLLVALASVGWLIAAIMNLVRDATG